MFSAWYLSWKTYFCDSLVATGNNQCITKKYSTCNSTVRGSSDQIRRSGGNSPPGRGVVALEGYPTAVDVIRPLYYSVSNGQCRHPQSPSPLAWSEAWHLPASADEKERRRQLSSSDTLKAQGTNGNRTGVAWVCRCEFGNAGGRAAGRSCGPAQCRARPKDVVHGQRSVVCRNQEGLDALQRNSRGIPGCE